MLLLFTYFFVSADLLWYGEPEWLSNNFQTDYH